MPSDETGDNKKRQSGVASNIQAWANKLAAHACGRTVAMALVATLAGSPRCPRSTGRVGGNGGIQALLTTSNITTVCKAPVPIPRQRNKRMYFSPPETSNASLIDGSNRGNCPGNRRQAAPSTTRAHSVGPSGGDCGLVSFATAVPAVASTSGTALAFPVAPAEASSSASAISDAPGSASLGASAVPHASASIASSSVRISAGGCAGACASVSNAHIPSNGEVATAAVAAWSGGVLAINKLSNRYTVADRAGLPVPSSVGPTSSGTSTGQRSPPPMCHGGSKVVGKWVSSSCRTRQSPPVHHRGACGNSCSGPLLTESRWSFLGANHNIAGHAILTSSGPAACCTPPARMQYAAGSAPPHGKPPGAPDVRNIQCWAWAGRPLRWKRRA
mmetsp:Transcript_1957/g.5916  ORF Transcript_1957/g.5916 Transcript_1957/m.5916 type:complete len:388 (+) Transcript_1957:264-1427(+)